MTVTKAVVRGILIASITASSARGGSILYLGVSSGDLPASTVAPSPVSLPVSFAQVGPAPSLHLGVYTNPAPIPFTPSPPTAPTLPSLSLPDVPDPTSASNTAQPPPPSGKYDAFINLNSGPYPDAVSLTTGNPQPWYLGTSVDRLFGGIPSIQQAAAFDATVLQRVQQTFALSGVPVSLTTDPNAPAAHTISVVSQSSNPTIGSALGMTYLGENGFQYIDTAANSASTVNQLEWIVAHNLAHELMLAFGVPEVHDQSGQFIDSPVASWSMMTNPNSTFSPGAVSDLLSRNFQATGGMALNPSAQLLGPPTVPEPSTVILWAAIGSVGLVIGQARGRGVGRKG
jgi:hypothetical protein